MKNRVILIIDQALILLIQAVFFLTPLYFSFFYNDFSVFSLDKTVLFKILIGSLFILTLIKFLIAGEIRGTFKFGRTFFYLPFFLVLIITTFFSTDPANSFAGSYWRQQGLVAYLYYLLFIILLLITIKERRQIDKIINAVLWSSLIVSLYGIYQWLGMDSFPWQKAVAVGGRVISTFGQPVFLGNFLLLVIFLAVYKFVVAESLYKRFFFALLFAAQLLCLIFTYTRGAWLGFAAGSLAILFFIFRKYKLKKVIISSAVLFILFLLFLGKTNNFFTFRIKSMADFGSGSVALRLKYWEAGVKAIAERPLTGYGLENEQSAILKYYDPSWAVFETIGSSPDRLHNELLDLTLQGGIVLALSYLYILFYLFYKAINILPKLDRRDGWLLIALLAGLFSYQVALLTSFSTIDTNPLFWAYTAFILIIINGLDSEPRRWNKPINSGLAVVGVMAIICVAFLIYNDVAKIRADYHFRLARVAYAQENYLSMVNEYLKVFDYNSKEKFYGWFFSNDIEAALNTVENQNFKKSILTYLKNYLANNQSVAKNYEELLKRGKMLTLLGFYENGEYFEKAEKIYEKLAGFNPYIYDTYNAWARLAVYRGDYSRALALYDKALFTIPPANDPKLNDEHRQELNRARAEVYKSMAYCYKESGRMDEEKSAYKKILNLDPYRLDIYDLLARAYYGAGNIDLAILYNQRGLSLDAKNFHWPWALSLLYREKGDMFRAEKYLADALSLAPEDQELKQYEKEINNNQ